MVHFKLPQHVYIQKLCRSSLTKENVPEVIKNFTCKVIDILEESKEHFVPFPNNSSLIKLRDNKEKVEIQ